MEQQTITFNGNRYVQSRLIGQANNDYAPIAISEQPMVNLLTLYNLVSANLGRGRVKRFADAKTAVKRTWAILVEWANQPADEFEMSAEELAGQKARQTERFVMADGGDAMAIQPNPQLRPFQKEALDAIGNNTVAVTFKKDTGKALLSEQLITAAALAKASAPAKAPRWARPKREEAAKIAYRPKADTVQAFMYGLLTTTGGVTMEVFCSLMKQHGTKDQTLYTPSMVWSALRYLFVSLRGYGLAFDGTKLSLLVPADERDAVKGEGK